MAVPVAGPLHSVTRVLANLELPEVVEIQDPQTQEMPDNLDLPDNQEQQEMLANQEILDLQEPQEILVLHQVL